jgi:hypothetical protein
LTANLERNEFLAFQTRNSFLIKQDNEIPKKDMGFAGDVSTWGGACDLYSKQSERGCKARCFIEVEGFL